MSSLNRVILIGNVGGVDVKGEGESKILQVSLATADGYRKKTGEWQDRTEWHRCIFAIPKLVETAMRISKGDKIMVEGSIRTNSWTTKDGEKKEIKEISVTSFKTFTKAVAASEQTANQPPVHGVQGTQAPTPGILNSEADDDLPF
jgi:single-strand DNA-binding protein